MYISSNISYRVLRLLYKKEAGTCFAIEVDGRQYIVTAKHLVESMRTDDKIGIYHDNSWEYVVGSLVGHADDADVSVLSLPFYFFPVFPVTLSDFRGMFIGQELYFLGFPYDLSMKIRRTDPLPTPFLKRGMLSGIGDNRFYLDAHNNPGFSGGPVFLPITNPDSPTIVGVVSGYFPGTAEIHQGRGASLNVIQGIVSNSGIMTVSSLSHALDLIEQNPIGFPIAEESS